MQIINKPIVVWDVGGTLITIKKLDFFLHIRPILIIYFWFYYIKSGHYKLISFSIYIQNFYLNILNKIPSPCNDIDYKIYGEHGKELPPLLRDAILGKLSCKIIRTIIENWLLKNNSIFKNNLEKKLFKKLYLLDFDPEIFIANHKLTTYAKLLQNCSNKKNTCIILSNFVKDWLPAFKQKFNKTILQYTDNQIFSCNVGYAKPNLKIYEKCQELYKDRLNETWIFIDDQKENRIAAESLGWIAVHPAHAEELLKKYNLI